MCVHIRPANIEKNSNRVILGTKSLQPKQRPKRPQSKAWRAEGQDRSRRRRGWGFLGGEGCRGRVPPRRRRVACSVVDCSSMCSCLLSLSPSGLSLLFCGGVTVTVQVYNRVFLLTVSFTTSCVWTTTQSSLYTTVVTRWFTQLSNTEPRLSLARNRAHKTWRCAHGVAPILHHTQLIYGRYVGSAPVAATLYPRFDWRRRVARRYNFDVHCPDRGSEPIPTSSGVNDFSLFWPPRKILFWTKSVQLWINGLPSGFRVSKRVTRVLYSNAGLTRCSVAQNRKS